MEGDLLRTAGLFVSLNQVTFPASAPLLKVICLHQQTAHIVRGPPPLILTTHTLSSKCRHFRGQDTVAAADANVAVCVCVCTPLGIGLNFKGTSQAL